jgi:hypothetical protein
MWDSKQYPVKDRCEDGTQGSFTLEKLMVVCVIKYTQRENEKNVAQIIPVAGSFPSHPLDPMTTLLQSASSSDVEGVRVELHGQIYRDQQQSAIIELACDASIDVIAISARLRIVRRTTYAVI